MGSTVAFLRAHARPDRAGVGVHTVTYTRGDGSLPADLYLPRNTNRRLPGYVLLHGLTCTARAHPSLQRFARAVCASGHIVLVPEIPEWRALHVAPAVTIETIRAAVRALHDRVEVDSDRIGLFGFSFGATQALVAAADPEVARLMRGLVAWGGYCDLERLFRFGLTGEHEWNGVQHVIDPDPYGRWIMLGNYLTRVPGHEQDGDVAAAAHELARIAGERAIPSYDPELDPVKDEIRERLAPEKRVLFDRIAPPANQPAQGTPENRALGVALARAALAADPLLDPQPFLGEIRVRTILAHGRDDRLVPYTETLRLARALPRQFLTGTAITSLFAHSGGAQHGLGPIGLAREAARFIRMIRRILNLL